MSHEEPDREVSATTSEPVPGMSSAAEPGVQSSDMSHTEPALRRVAELIKKGKGDMIRAVCSQS